jgi:TonB family protein
VNPYDGLTYGYEGKPKVWIRVSGQGRVIEAKLRQGCGDPILNDDAVRYCKTLRFSPARRGDTLIEWEEVWTVNYYWSNRKK